MTVPTVTTIHDISFFIEPKWFGWKDRTLLRVSIPASIRRAAKVLAVSETSRQEMIDVLHVTPDKIVATPLGVPSYCSRAAQPQSSSNVLFVGGLQARKNWRVAIEAVAIARRQWPDLTLTITGRSRVAEADLRGAIARWEAQEWLELTGGIPTDELVRRYQSAFVVIHPSLHEGFGLTPLEAFACGAPVIASDRGAIPEVAGDAAILLDPEDAGAWSDAILSLRMGDLRERLLDKGLARARKFTWAETASRTMDVYEAVVARNTYN
jgi:glycosyltransferase involved in cell wall biosynthesis